MRKPAILLTSLLILVAQILRADIKCGEKAPSFVLPSANGTIINTESFAGRYVVLEWFNHNCQYVNKFYKNGNMQKWQADAVSKGIVWLVVDSTNPSNPDFLPPKTARTLFTANKMAATALLLDEDGIAGTLYGATNTPEVFLINPDGILIYQGAIDDNSSRNPEDVAISHNYLLAAIDDALAGKPVAEPTTAPYGCEVKYLPGRYSQKSGQKDSDASGSANSAKSPSTRQNRRGKRVKRAS